ncbi:hypothetical protein LTR16_001091 [Cryomyces antarcticus]|uniref:Uncharacterized protein n=1 Tax=Cryomyces antarcticus TaxID=329879 RepID=A0ABR0M1T8_9PEZI|nr:hypothetical protein LTR39_000750 [Cryomyces antarcticus]KAK5257286.1 hypothetical protein LTR16_001091 [Cryomyces antarcticus]
MVPFGRSRAPDLESQNGSSPASECLKTVLSGEEEPHTGSKDTLTRTIGNIVHEVANSATNAFVRAKASISNLRGSPNTFDLENQRSRAPGYIPNTPDLNNSASARRRHTLSPKNLGSLRNWGSSLRHHQSTPSSSSPTKQLAQNGHSCALESFRGAKGPEQYDLDGIDGTLSETEQTESLKRHDSAKGWLSTTLGRKAGKKAAISSPQRVDFEVHHSTPIDVPAPTVDLNIDNETNLLSSINREHPSLKMMEAAEQLRNITYEQDLGRTGRPPTRMATQVWHDRESYRPGVNSQRSKLTLNTFLPLTPPINDRRPRLAKLEEPDGGWNRADAEYKSNLPTPMPGTTLPFFEADDPFNDRSVLPASSIEDASASLEADVKEVLGYPPIPNLLDKMAQQDAHDTAITEEELVRQTHTSPEFSAARLPLFGCGDEEPESEDYALPPNKASDLFRPGRPSPGKMMNFVFRAKEVGLRGGIHTGFDTSTGATCGFNSTTTSSSTQSSQRTSSSIYSRDTDFECLTTDPSMGSSNEFESRRADRDRRYRELQGLGGPRQAFSRASSYARASQG